MSETILLPNHFGQKIQHEKRFSHAWGPANPRMTSPKTHVWFGREFTRYFNLESQMALVSNLAEQYEAGLISVGRAAEVAGLKYDTLLEEFEKRGVQLHFGPVSIEEAERREKRLVESLKKLRRSP
jgi:hypothetical protein